MEPAGSGQHPPARGGDQVARPTGVRARVRRLRPIRPRPVRPVLAWAVHVLTASGAVVGAAALLAIVAGEWSRAALWMLLALVIDAVDGSLARAVGVKQALPRIDGRRLDDIVDYLNYVIVPVVFLVAAGHLAVPWAAVPILASAWGFAREDAKTADGFFLGFPSYWNVVAIYAWLLQVSPAVTTAFVLFFAVAVFVPLKYLHPSRMTVLRKSTNLAAAVWVMVLAAAAADPERAARLHLAGLSLLFPAWYVLLSLWIGGLARGRQDPA